MKFLKKKVEIKQATFSMNRDSFTQVKYFKAVSTMYTYRGKKAFYFCLASWNFLKF